MLVYLLKTSNTLDDISFSEELFHVSGYLRGYAEDLVTDCWLESEEEYLWALHDFRVLAAYGVRGWVELLIIKESEFLFKREYWIERLELKDGKLFRAELFPTKQNPEEIKIDKRFIDRIWLVNNVGSAPGFETELALDVIKEDWIPLEDLVKRLKEEEDV